MWTKRKHLAPLLGFHLLPLGVVTTSITLGQVGIDVLAVVVEEAQVEERDAERVHNGHGDGVRCCSTR